MKLRPRYHLTAAMLLFVIAWLLTGCPSSLPREASPLPEPIPAREPVSLSIFINHPWYSVDSFSGIIPDEITARTGVTLEAEIAVDSQQLGMKAASNDLPDLVYTQDLIDRLSNSTLSHCYTDLIEEYGLDWDIDPVLRENALVYSKDGKLYTVLNHYTSTEDWVGSKSVPMVGSMLIRQDILDSLGNPPITTFDELMAAYAMVKDRYPDMVPMTFNSSHRFNVMLCWSGLGTAPFAEQEDGSYLYYIRDERYRELMRFLNQMYQNGYLLAENFAAGASQQAAITTSLYDGGQAFTFSTCTQNSNIYSQASLSRINPSYHSVEMVPLEGSNFSVANLGWSGTFITKSNRNPGASIEFIRWMFTAEAQKLTQWGREGIEYVLDDSMLPVFSEDVLESIASDTYARSYNPWFYLGGSAIFEAQGRCALLPWEEYEKPYNAIRERYRNLAWIAAALPNNGEAEKDIYKRISGSVSSYESKVILSATDADFEDAFAEYMKNIALMDVERLEAYMTERIPDIKAKYEAMSNA